MKIKDTTSNFKDLLKYVSLGDKMFGDVYTIFKNGTGEFHGVSIARTLYMGVIYTPELVEIDHSLDEKKGKKIEWLDGEFFVDPDDILSRMKNISSGNVTITYERGSMKVSGKMRFTRKNPFLLRYDEKEFSGIKASNPPEPQGYLDGLHIQEVIQEKIRPQLRFKMDVSLDEIKGLINSSSVMKNPSMVLLGVSKDGNVSIKVIERDEGFIGDEFELPLGTVDIPDDFDGCESWFGTGLSKVVENLGGDATIYFDNHQSLIIEKKIKLKNEKLGREYKFELTYLVLPALEDDNDDDDDDDFDPEALGAQIEAETEDYEDEDEDDDDDDE